MENSKCKGFVEYRQNVRLAGPVSVQWCRSKGSVDLGPRFIDKDGVVPPALINGVHPTAAGYEVWGTAIKEPLDNLLHDRALDGSPLPVDSAK
jgi:hypothetical protein